MTDTDRIKEFLAAQEIMVIAVVLPDGSPWAVPVHARHIGKGVFVWESKSDTVHSEAIEERPQVAITIFEGMVGFYATGTATLIDISTRGVGRYEFTATAMWMTDETYIKRSVVLV